MGRTRIKICGISDEDALLAAVDAGADAVGFMFVEESPRFIDPEEAYALMSMLPPMVASVGVFANPDPDDFAEIEQACTTSFSQLHGNEDAKLVKACGPDIIKAIRFDAATIAHELEKWSEHEDIAAILVDGSAGGEGVAFDWKLLAPLIDTCPKPVIIAGGLHPGNVAEAIRLCRPFGVDVSSGVEREKGIKDIGLIEAFCEAVQRADLG